MSRIATSKPAKSNKNLLTYEDYLTFPDNDGIRKEIIEGELFMTPAPSLQHQAVSKNLFRFLDEYVSKNNLGEVWYAPCDVIFSEINVVQPDIFYVSKENMKIVTSQNIKGAPDLIIEIASPATKKTDRSYKKLIYEKFGVKEYWIIDPDEQTVEVYVLEKRKMKLFHQAKKTGQIKSQMFPALKIDLQSIVASKI